MGNISIQYVVRDGVISKHKSTDVIIAKTQPAPKIQSRIKLTENPVVQQNVTTPRFNNISSPNPRKIVKNYQLNLPRNNQPLAYETQIQEEKFIKRNTFAVKDKRKEEIARREIQISYELQMHEDQLNREEERQRRNKGLQTIQQRKDPIQMAYDEGERR